MSTMFEWRESLRTGSIEARRCARLRLQVMRSRVGSESHQQCTLNIYVLYVLNTNYFVFFRAAHSLQRESSSSVRSSTSSHHPAAKLITAKASGT